MSNSVDLLMRSDFPLFTFHSPLNFSRRNLQILNGQIPEEKILMVVILSLIGLMVVFI